jgi:dihydrofolate reductase
MSLDGFIAGPDDDLSWLPHDDAPGEGAVDFDRFLSDVGAMLMGRRTYDVVQGFDAWAYGDTPVLVPTHRPLTSTQPTVRAVQGAIDALLDEALELADGADVYVDGGDLVRQALEVDRLDELIVTLVPVVLGGGVPLFGSRTAPLGFTFDPPATYGTMVQLRARRDRG